MNPLTGSPPPGPVLAVSPSILDFGLAGVGRPKDLMLTVQNKGGGKLAGTATVTAPFVISDNQYSLRSGQSKALRVRYMPTAQGTNSGSVVFSGEKSVTVAVTGVARTPPSPPGNLKITSRFGEEEAADFIARYYRDDTSYVLKPPMMDTLMDKEYQSVCDRAFLLKLAAQQPRHDLAVIVLNHYQYQEDEDFIKLAWIKDLEGLGYQRIVFLLAGDSMKKMKTVNGLRVLEDRHAPRIPAGK